MHFIELDKVNIEYLDEDEREDKSKGEILLFIHGSGSNARMWEPQIEYFKKNNRVIALSLPGHADSDQMQVPITVDNYTEFVNKFIERICEDKKPIIIGHSLGSAIVQVMALKYSKFIKAIILIGSGAKLKVMQMIFEFLSSGYEEFIKMGTSFAFSKKNKNSPVIEKYKEISMLTQGFITRADFQACNQFDVMNEIGNIDLPTLIITGSDDKLTPVKYANFLAQKIKGAQLHIIDEAGHMVNFENSDEINGIIEKFVQNL
ncbi:MAG: alpha/beta hydrolase [Candidatus Lokiarchaeota archaeon]|nr:alpha/beta hydrolase [Candidatus Lokiarchaeota archaeon]